MFGLNDLFRAISRLTSSISRTAELFDQANKHLEDRLGVTLPLPEESQLPYSPPPFEESEQGVEPARGNGRTRAKNPR